MTRFYLVTYVISYELTTISSMVQVGVNVENNDPVPYRRGTRAGGTKESEVSRQGVCKQE